MKLKIIDLIKLEYKVSNDGISWEKKFIEHKDDSSIQITNKYVEIIKGYVYISGIVENGTLIISGNNNYKIHNLEIHEQGTLYLNNPTIPAFIDRITVYSKGTIHIGENMTILNKKDHSKNEYNIYFMKDSILKVTNNSIRLKYINDDDDDMYKLAIDNHLHVKNTLTLKIDTTDGLELPEGLFNKDQSFEDITLTLTNLINFTDKFIADDNAVEFDYEFYMNEYHVVNSLSKELKKSNEELKESNEELERLNRNLKRSNEELESLNRDLKRSNDIYIIDYTKSKAEIKRLRRLLNE